MEAIFLQIVNLSITAGWMILAVLLLRVILRKAPKWVFCMLWGMVAVRLLCPVTLESAWSLIPSSKPLPENIIYTAQPYIQSGVTTIDNLVNPMLDAAMTPNAGDSANPTQVWAFILSLVWIAGMVIMAVYAWISYAMLKRRVSTATLLEKGVKQSEAVDSPFVLGVFRPMIYLPYGLEDADLAHVIAHERAHIARKDHWWKPLGFLLLTIYWFHPLMWVAYILLCRDIEAACDEKVICNMEEADKKGYSTALLHCSMKRRLITACPLAFGEVGVKERIKGVMNYKKPTFWILLLALLATVIVAVCLMTNPREDGHGNSQDSAGEVESTETTESLGKTEDLMSEKDGDANVDETEDAEMAQKLLTLNDVIILSGKGEELTWSDFAKFRYEDVGSGLYIYSYEINPVFHLLIGGGSTEEMPSYIRLVASLSGDYIDIRKESVTDFISLHSYDLLDYAVRTAILEKHTSDHSKGLIRVESHKVLSTEHRAVADTNVVDQVTVYALVLYQGYSPYSTAGNLISEEGSYIPTALTFSVDEAGQYTLEEYWLPGDGSYYANDIKNKFPGAAADDALNAQDYIDELQAECQQKALKLMEAYLEEVNAQLEQNVSELEAAKGYIIDVELENLLEVICTTTKSISSSPADFIEENREEYETLLSYRQYTLKFCFKKFLAGGQTDLKGQIMEWACRDLIEGEWQTSQVNIPLYANGQEWFDKFKEDTLMLADKSTTDELEKYHPASKLLLDMMEQMEE